MGKKLDLVNNKFGKIIVLKESNYLSKSGNIYWECECECGTIFRTRGYSLTSGHTSSCGCIGRGRLNIVGKRYGKLLVTEYIGKDDTSHTLWKCKCDCGNECIIVGSELGRRTNSCGCLKTKHGCNKKGNRLGIYGSWGNMMQRCYKPDGDSSKYYFGKGIRVYKKWHNFINFREWAMSNGYEDGLTIDRVDSDKGYFPSNCQWVSIEENMQRARTKRWRNYRIENGE
jgi:hypothetical protein